jgi:hypothetical protein
MTGKRKLTPLVSVTEKNLASALFALSESIEWFIEDQSFLMSYDLAPSPNHPLPSANCLSFSVFLRVAGRACWRERRGKGGGETNRTTRRWGSLVLYKLLNTLRAVNWRAVERFAYVKQVLGAGVWTYCPERRHEHPPEQQLPVLHLGSASPLQVCTVCTYSMYSRVLPSNDLLHDSLIT